MASNSKDIVIVGGGLAGLTCAVILHRAGQKVKLLEATDRVGGRIKTDQIDGFLLDRGFQVYQTSYPNAAKYLNLQALNLKSFRNGCLIKREEDFAQVADPWRNPILALGGLFSSPGNLSDIPKIASLRSRVLSKKEPHLWLDAPQTTTLDRLQQYGFSESMIRSFFIPFLGGVFLEKELSTSSRMLDFVFSNFSRGSATLPAEGMEAIPRQLAGHLPVDSVHTQTTVASIDGNTLNLDNGQTLVADAIVVATEMPAASRLLKRDWTFPYRQTRCAYFASTSAPIDAPVLVLNGTGNGVVDSLCCPSRVQPSYAPADQTLISVTSIGTPNLDIDQWQAEVRSELRRWFGNEVERWRHLITYNIPFALPDQSVSNMEPVQRAPRVAENIYQCGDYCDTRSIDGAILSGERAAQAVLQDL